MNNICIIPARGNSKGLKNKNILEFCKKPLIYWSIHQALKCKHINKGVYVTSDSDEILDIAKKYGATPIKRPKELASDIASSEAALLHCLNEIQNKGTKVDNIVFLQATSPLRKDNDIENAFDKFLEEKLNSLFSSVLLKDLCIWSCEKDFFSSINYDYKKRKRRQDLKKKFLENGSIYIFENKILTNYKNRLAEKIGTYVMEDWQEHQIDTLDDFELCEYIFIKNKLSLKI